MWSELIVPKVVEMDETQRKKIYEAANVALNVCIVFYSVSIAIVGCSIVIDAEMFVTGCLVNAALFIIAGISFQVLKVATAQAKDDTQNTEG